MLATFGSKLVTAVLQPTVQAIAAGVLTGVVAGGTLIVAGVIPPPAPGTTALLACPGSGAVMANVPAGQSLLATARSEDGAWLEIYIGQPGIDGAWAPAAAVHLQGSVEGLPVADCAPPSSAEPTPQPLPSPPPTVEPSIAGTIVPTVEPTLGPSLPPGATPSPTPVPTATPKATVKTTTTPTMTPLPPPPTIPPTPGPTPDNQKPALSGLAANPNCVDLGTPASTISVQATDNEGVLSVSIGISPPSGSPFVASMTHGSGNTWYYVFYFSASYGEGQVSYTVTAKDLTNNTSDPAYSDPFSDTNRLYNATSGCFIG